jgi:hypothetical protein
MIRIYGFYNIWPGRHSPGLLQYRYIQCYFHITNFTALLFSTLLSRYLGTHTNSNSEWGNESVSGEFFRRTNVTDLLTSPEKTKYSEFQNLSFIFNWFIRIFGFVKTTESILLQKIVRKMRDIFNSSCSQLAYLFFNRKQRSTLFLL